MVSAEEHHHRYRPYVTRVTYSDNIKSESDTIEVELDDTDGRWLDNWYPGRGHADAENGLSGREAAVLRYVLYRRDRGEFARVRCRYPGRGHVGQQRPADKIQSWFREHHAGGYRRTDCQKHQLKLVGSIESIKIDRVTQYAETDVGFLRRLASEYGYAVKVVSDQLIFSHLATLRGQEPVKQLKPQDVASFSLRDTINRVYKSAKVKHQKSSDKS